MLLESVNIVGFRGIQRIALSLDRSTVLIGENQWGKSSLLDALMLLLSAKNELYQFTVDDFHRATQNNGGDEQHLQVIFTFSKPINHYRSEVDSQLDALWVNCNDNIQRIYYRVEGENHKGNVITRRSFLNQQGLPLTLTDTDQLALRLQRIHPALRLRDSRLINGNGSSSGSFAFNDRELLKQMDLLLRKNNLVALSNKEISNSLKGIRLLIENYFVNQRNRNKRYRDSLAEPELSYWQAVDALTQTLEQLDVKAKPIARNVRVILLGLFLSVVHAIADTEIEPGCRPILLLEDQETRFHPVMLSVVWGLFDHLPLQKLTTTNSGDLLALVPIENICRMVRESNRVATYRLAPNSLNHIDYRRIAFHIRFNRISALFARSWLLVEGETEVWLLSELASQCGYHLESEGIKIIEFAQSGLKPLLKFAHQMGIEWHVLVDGDEAGKKYAATVRSFVENRHRHEREHLTQLPALDMENFMYRQGFSDVYHRIAGITVTNNISVKKIIQKAIHKTSKPDLAIEVAEQARIIGVDSIPTLLKKMFSQIIWKARGQSDVN